MSDETLVATSLGALYDGTLQLLLTRGRRRPPAATGPAGVRSVLECVSYQGTLQAPRHRLIRGNEGRYSPGQAAARFLYMLSGSDRREHIEFYTGPVAAYSPDGIALGGSAHGVRLFHRVLGRSLFEHSCSCLEADGESNRAVIPFYWPTDVGGGPRDVPCVLAILPYRRGGTLSMSVHMRAQELSRLFAYDIFEFTMLQEFMASLLGLELGSYAHSAFALHCIAKDGATENVDTLSRKPHDAPPMSPMPSVEAKTREVLVAWEEGLRSSMLSGTAEAYLSRLQAEAPPYWFDLLAGAAAHALSRRSGPLDWLRKFAPTGHPILELELDSIAAWRKGQERTNETV